MNYKEANQKLLNLKEDVEFKEQKLKEAIMELEVWEDYIAGMISKGRK